MRTVLTVHTSHLMAFPDLVDSLSGIYAMMDSRVCLFNRMSRLQGKLDLMLSQLGSQASSEEEEPLGSQQPLLLYNDDSSDEELEDDLVADNSESEDENWGENGVKENGVE